MSLFLTKRFQKCCLISLNRYADRENRFYISQHIILHIHHMGRMRFRKVNLFEYQGEIFCENISKKYLPDADTVF